MAVTNTQKIQIELDGNPPFEYVVAKQEEKESRVIEVTLLENKREFTIPAGTSAKIKYYKPDGKKVLNNCEINGNVIKVTYTEQMLAAEGTGRGEIVLYNGASVLRSATFYTKMVPTVYEENGLISDSEFLSLAESILEVKQATDRALNAASTAEAAAEDANSATEAADTAATAANSAATAANTAANSANSAATTANNAASEASAAATACEGIVNGLNTMVDTVTNKSCVLSIEDGILTIREA